MPLPSWATSDVITFTPLNLLKCAQQGLPGHNIELRGQTLLICPLEAEKYEDIAEVIATLCRRADASRTRLEIWLPVVNGHLSEGLERQRFQIAITDTETDIGPHHVLRRTPTKRRHHANTA